MSAKEKEAQLLRDRSLRFCAGCNNFFRDGQRVTPENLGITSEERRDAQIAMATHEQHHELINEPRGTCDPCADKRVSRIQGVQGPACYA
jgi:hypothetical protein